MKTAKPESLEMVEVIKKPDVRRTVARTQDDFWVNKPEGIGLNGLNCSSISKSQASFMKPEAI